MCFGDYMFRKQVTNKFGMLGLCIVGLVLVLGNGATASSQWLETSYNDFNGSDTISGLEIKAAGALDVGKVHLEDNSSQLHSNIYNDPTATQILCEDPNANPAQIGKYSQSFYPTIEGVVDRVDVMIYYTGDYIFHTIPGEGVTAATVTIKIVDANQQTKLPAAGGNTYSQRTVNYNYFPSQSGTWTTFWFSYCDSTGDSVSSQIALSANAYYCIVVSSNADWDSTHTSEIYMEYKVSNNVNTQCGEWDTANPAWHNGVVGNPPQDYDFPFNITVHNFVSSGYLISKVYNTNNPGTTLDSIQWGYDTIVGVTYLHIYTRGGDTSPPDGTWSSWLEQTNYWASLNPSTPSPHGQYMQYKLEFSSDDDCFTAFVDHVLITYT